MLTKALVYSTLGTLITLGSIPAVQAALRPNILYLYADDLGWGTRSLNRGSETSLITPTIDSLADAGINFRMAYGCMVCSPARSSQQTGFHQGHTWTDRNDPHSSKAIRADDKTIGDMLGAAGYRVGYYGKWGYGANSALINPTINNPQTLPINHGYTDLLAELHHVRAHTFFQESLWFNNIDTHGLNTVLEYNANTNQQKQAYADDLYAEAAEDFIRTHAASAQPFFCEIAFQVPHTPLGDVIEMPGWFDAYAGTTATNWPVDAQQYAAMLNRQDGHIADLLAALEDPNNDGNTNDSIRANTLIIFASDNGGQGGTPHDYFDTNGNLSGRKGSVLEGGIRVPTFFNWQGVISPGQSTDHITCVSDVLPTLCELAGILPPPGIDGVSIAPLLTGEGQQRVRPWYTHESGNTWSLIRNDGYKLRNTGALYFLADGSNTNYEDTDLSAAHPEIVDEMQAIAMAERVTEPNNFANTYHHWTGTNGAHASDAANWSDYDYSNAGVSYLSDSGAPRESWNATLANTGSSDQTAILDASIHTLGIEIAGNPDTQARQRLNIQSGHTLTGRNEIRLSPYSEVRLNGGKLNSVRWVDLLEGASIQGPGTIDAILYNSGTLDTSIRRRSGSTTISSDYHQTAAGSLGVLIGSQTSLVVTGTAHLDGQLHSILPKNFSGADGDRFTVISAQAVVGTFRHADNMIKSGAHHFRIHYSATQVELEKVGVTIAGTPRWWLTQHGLTNGTPEAEELLDTDGDGFTAQEEFITGTDPTKASSSLVMQHSGPGQVVKWPSTPYRIYELQKSTNLLTGFQIEETGIPSTPPENSYTDPSDQVKGFYRVQVETE